MIMESLKQTPEDSAYTDNIRFGDNEFEKAHGLKCAGNVKSEILDTEMGALKEKYSVRTVQGKGSELSVEIKSSHGKPLLLEIREIHSRRQKAFGYTVLVNGKETYFRSYEEYGAGPNHFFVWADSSVVGKSGTSTISFRSEGGPAFSISEVWAYSDFFGRVVPQESVQRKMPLFVGFNNCNMAEKLKDYSDFKCYSPVGRLSFITYGSNSIDNTRSKLHEELKDSASSDFPLSYVISGYGWGGMPTGPDGLGGYFCDPRYSGISFNESDGAFRASWPNMWSSSPFLTKCDRHMNDFLYKRLSRIIGDLPDQLDWLKADGASAFPMLIREWGGNGGEITDATINEAKRDGINLDPKNLGYDERLWLYRHAVEIWQSWAEQMMEFAGRDSVMVEEGEVKLPEEQMSSYLFSHPDFLSDLPMNDQRWSAGQIGMSEGFSSSGEMGRGVEYREISMYDYLRARGRLAMVNMERTMLKDDFTVLRNHYQRGFQFIVFFNSYEGDEKFIRQMDHIDDEPCLPEVHREPSILQVVVPRDRNIGSKENLEFSANLKVHNSLRVAVEDCGKPGQLTYRLENSGEEFVSGLSLHLDGRISPGAGNSIEVHVGETPAQMRKVKVLSASELPCPDHWTPYMTSETSLDLGDDMEGKKTYFLKLVFNASHAPDASFLLSIHVGAKWGRKSGHIDGNPFKIGMNRTLQLWVQDRAISEIMLKKYLKAGDADEVYVRAEDLFRRGWYRSASRLISGEISQLLPARYLVRGHGRLGRYPVEVILPGKDQSVLVVLYKMKGTECEFELKTRSERQSGRVTFTGLQAGHWKLSSLSRNRYRFESCRNGASAIATGADGKVSFALEVLGRESERIRLPEKLVARCLEVTDKEIAIDFQDHELMGYDRVIRIPLKKDTSFLRRPDCAGNSSDAAADKPQAMDQVELMLDGNQEVASVLARYGQESGRIKSFEPPVLVGKLSNGVIELESGNRYAFHFNKTTGTICDTAALRDSILNYEFRHLVEAFRPGQEISLTYCPYAEKGGIKRLRSVKQDYRILLEEDFTDTTGDEWKRKILSIDGVDVIDHRPEPNYLHHIVIRLLRPNKAFAPGNIIYHVNGGNPLKTTVVEFTARAFEDSSAVEFWISADNVSWVKAGQFDNTWQNNIPQSSNSKYWKFPWQFIDVTRNVKGLDSFYLKMVLRVNSADERYCVGAVRVLTEQ
jgi:hypothetical protein